MDLSKLQAAAQELEAESDRCRNLAAEIRAAIKRHANGAGTSVESKPLIPPRASRQRPLPLANANGEQKSVRTLALELIEQSDKPIHVDELVKRINERRHDPTNRAAVESQLVRAIKTGKFKVKRTSPGTFGVG